MTYILSLLGETLDAPYNNSVFAGGGLTTLSKNMNYRGTNYSAEELMGAKYFFPFDIQRKLGPKIEENKITLNNLNL